MKKKEISTQPLTQAIAVAIGMSVMTAHADTIVVNGYSYYTFNKCRLRDAIIAANNDAPVNACSAGSGDDVLDLSSLAGETIFLELDLPAVTSNITVQGGGAIINGLGNQIFNATSNTLTIDQLWLNNGYADKGGAVYANNAQVNINNSTLSGNTANFGGAVATEGSGDAFIFNSTISYNLANDSGGGVWASGDFIGLDYATVVKNNAFNVSDQANQLGFDGGTLSITNSLVGDSDGTDCQALPGNGGSHLAGNNLVENDGNCFPASAYLIEGSAPDVGTFGDNGGLTPTMVPNSTSMAVDVVPSCTTSYDQRGFPRDADCDLGAVEYAAALQSGPDFVVNSEADANDGYCGLNPGGCTLREAVFASNADTDASTISFANDGMTVTLETQLPKITTTVTLQGGATLTSDGDNRLMLVGDPGSMLRLSDMTLTGGTAAARGGAVNVGPYGYLELVNSTLHGNSAPSGGAIYADLGHVTVINSTISGNSADEGGGIYAYLGATVVLQNATIAYNSANVIGGGVNLGYNAELDLTLSVLAGNGSTDCRIKYLANHTIIPRAENLVQSFGNCDLTGQVLSQSASLYALSMNGGPTPTHAPTLGSPLIDAGNNAFVSETFDQRGAPYARINGSNVDLGAVEFFHPAQAGPAFLINSLGDDENGVCEELPGDCTLREAINAAEADGVDSTVSFDGSITPATSSITLTGNLSIVTTPITIQGGGILVDGNFRRHFYVTGESAHLQINEMTLANGSTGYDGGIIHARDDGQVTVTGSTLSNALVNGKGGAIYAHFATISLYNSTITGGTAGTGNGGAVALQHAQLNLTHVTISGNSTGIWGQGSSVNMTHSIVANSVGEDCDLNVSSSITLYGENLIESYNSCGSPDTSLLITGTDPMLGAMADNGGPTMTFKPQPGSPVLNLGDSDLYDGPYDQRGAPYARLSGGSLDLGAVEVQFTPQTGPNFVVNSLDDVADGECSELPGHCSLRDAANDANSYVGNATITFENSLAYNTITLTNGPLPASKEGELTIAGPVDGVFEGITIDGNNNSKILNGFGPDVFMEDLTLQNGFQSGQGGAIIMQSGKLQLDTVKVSGNSSTLSGGGIYSYGAVEITNSVITGNTAAESGGGIFADELLVAYSTIANNTVTDNGGTGGGLQLTGQLNMHNSTMANNSAYRSSAIDVVGEFNIDHSTIVHNPRETGAAIRMTNSESLPVPAWFITNTVVSLNPANDGGTDELALQTVTGSTPDLGLEFSYLGGDPMLGPYGDNGGVTGTFAPLKGSPLLNAGDPSANWALDQRGADRKFGPAVDIGSVEATFTPGTLSFENGTYSFDEDTGTHMLVVTRTGGTDGAVSATVNTVDVSAEGGIDYTAIMNGTVMWADGDAAPKMVSVTLPADSDFEPDEDFQVVLSVPTGGSVLGTDTTTVTILNDDPEPENGVLAIDPDSIVVDEDAGMAKLTVTRTGGSDGEVSATVNTANGTAEAGSDFTAITGGTITFADGAGASKIISVPITDDEEQEPTEQFTVTLSAPQGGAALGNATGTVEITDNDGPMEEVIFDDGFEEN